MRPTKVLIVDDHTLFGESLAHLLSTKDGVDVVGVAQSGEEALRQVEDLKPNVVLMDIEMKSIDGIETTRLVRKKYPEIGVIILTMHSEEEYMIDAIKAGARGYVLKNASSSSIVDAIQSVTRGEFAFNFQSSPKDALSNIVELLQDKSMRNESSLRPQEIKILTLISEGYTNKAISEKLYISVHTTRNHIANIFSKLGCSNRIRAVKEAQRKKII